MKIFHLITRDKFTAGYINFMKTYVVEHKHIFAISSTKYSEDDSVERDIIDFENVILYKNGKWLAFSPDIRKVLEDVDKIIVSGLFGNEKFIYFWPNKAFKKMYIQFWGGDFYQLRENNFKGINGIFQKKTLLSCIKKSYAFVFLIEGEYEKFSEITKIKKNNVFVAPMPMNEHYYNFEYIDNNTSKGIINILVGNSASEENCHLKAFTLLSKFKDNNINVYSPLSYGDKDYKENVILLGKKIFGKKFIPLCEWISPEDYLLFLSRCDIGVFCNNRQQGMGNINALLSFGKKVFMNPDTSMYNYYLDQGYSCFSTNDILYEDFNEFVHFSDGNLNKSIYKTIHSIECVKNKWNEILN